MLNGESHLDHLQKKANRKNSGGNISFEKDMFDEHDHSQHDHDHYQDHVNYPGQSNFIPSQMLELGASKVR